MQPADEAYLAAIAAAPDDDAPRLVYADVLQARGDPRGELIALQIALTRATDATPLLDAIEDLDLVHGDRWRHGLARAVAHLRRGFLAQLSISAVDLLRRADELFADAPALDLHLYSLDRVDLEQVAALPHLGKVRGLRLSTYGVPDAAVAALLASPHLGNVRRLEYGDLGPLATAQLGHGFPNLTIIDATLDVAERRRLLASRALPALRELQLVNGDDVAVLAAPHRRARWTVLSLAEVPGERLPALLAGGMPELRRLVISRSRIGPEGARAIAAAELPALRELDLGWNGLGRDGVAALLDAPFAAQLDSLDVAASLSRDDGAVLAQRRLPALRHLDVSHCYMLPVARALVTAELDGLESLAIGSDYVDEESIPLLANARNLGRLVSIAFGESRLPASSIRALAEATGLPSLRSLSLYRQGLDEPTVAALASAPGLPALRSLGLARCSLTREGLDSLLRGPVLARLERLDLTGLRTADRTLLALADNPDAARLRTLDLSDVHGVTGASLLAVVRSPHLQRLRDLGSRRWQLDAAEIRALLECPGLCRLTGVRLNVPRAERGKLAARFGRRVDLSTP